MSPETIQEIYRKQADTDLLNALGTPDGRRLLWQIIDERGGFLGVTFCGESTHQSAFNEGRRSICVELVADCQRVAPSEYVQMLREAVYRREEMRIAEEAVHG